jgi:hypothetical protein
MPASAIGEKLWIIPDGYIPEFSSGTLTSHESICVLNTASVDACLTITIFFEDRDPIEGIIEVVPARRNRHIRTSGLANKDGQTIPVGVPYAIEVQSDSPIIVQYSRLDSTQAENALLSVMAYPIKSN